MTDTNHAAILRQHADTRRRGHSVNPEVLRAAADEIERLRVIVQGWEHSARNSERDIQTLRAERDEARRMVCALDADIMEDQMEYARHRGWDCYREVNP